MGVTLVLLLLATVGLSRWSGGALRRVLEARAVLDIPNHRSSHAVPVPRGGGLAVALAWTLATIVAAVLYRGSFDERALACVFAATLLVAGIGWLEDLYHVGIARRLLVQAGASALVLVLVRPQPAAPSLLGMPAGSLMFGAVALLSLVWLVNLYNFMDGIDGIAAGTAAVAALHLGVLFLRSASPAFAASALSLAAACIGFLPLNLGGSARMFLGDVGSYLLGFGVGALAVAAGMLHAVPWGIAVLPLVPFIVDATWTLARRALRGDVVYAAHREHLYQRLVQVEASHAKLTVGYVAVAALLAAAAQWAAPRPTMQFPIVAGAIVGVIAGMQLCERRLAALARGEAP